MTDQIKAVIAAGTPPSEIADLVVEAMRDERLYILPHPQFLERVRQRVAEIEAGRPLVADLRTDCLVNRFGESVIKLQSVTRQVIHPGLFT